MPSKASYMPDVSSGSTKENNVMLSNLRRYSELQTNTVKGHIGAVRHHVAFMYALSVPSG